MTDVREKTRPRRRASAVRTLRASYIWYELMTPDADGAKAFYDPVVGWDIGEGVPEYGGYRMIGTRRRRLPAGVLPLTDEMM